MASNFLNEKKWKELAAMLAAEFFMIANNLDKHHDNVNVTRVAAGSLSVATGAVSLGATIAIPFTMGVSVVVAIVFGGIAAASGATAGGASIFRFIIEKKKLKVVENKWNEFRETLFKNMSTETKDRMRELVLKELKQEKGENLSAQFVRLCARGGPAVSVASSGYYGGKMLAQAGGIGARTVVTAGRAAVIPFTFVFSFLSAITIGISVFDIICASRELGKEEKSKCGDSIRTLGAFLKLFSEGEVSLDELETMLA